MNRRNFTTSALGLLASAFGVANAKPNGDGVVDDSLPLVRYTRDTEDVGCMAIDGNFECTLDGIPVGNDLPIVTVDERGGFVIMLSGCDEMTQEWNVKTGKKEGEFAWRFNGLYKKVYGNYRITGLTSAEREAHLDLMAHRVVASDPYKLEA